MELLYVAYQADKVTKKDKKESPPPLSTHQNDIYKLHEQPKIMREPIHQAEHNVVSMF